MFRLTIARVAVVGAGLAAAGGGVAATQLSSAPAVSATLAAAQSTTTPSPAAITPKPNHAKAHGLRHALALHLRHALVDATAKVTGQTVEQVRDQLHSRRSLDDIAGTKAAGIKATVEQDVRTRVEKAVDDKKITQAQADKLLTRLDATVDKIMAAHRSPKP